MPTYETSLPSSFATLTVRDLPATMRWYRDVLGFTIVAERPGLNGRPVEAHLRRGPGHEVVLVAASVPVAIRAPGQGVTLTFVLEEDVLALATRAAAAGTMVFETPLGNRRAAREITLLDPDGYRLAFVQVG
jgi:catechol 2,3-dioxygenase-like lactoylglutathione lyase family enzyme